MYKYIIIFLVLCTCIYGADDLVRQYVLMHDTSDDSDIFRFVVVDIKTESAEGKISEIVTGLSKCELVNNPAKKSGAHIFGSGQAADKYFSISAKVSLSENGLMVLTPVEGSFQKLEIGRCQIVNYLVRQYKEANSKL